MVRICPNGPLLAQRKNSGSKGSMIRESFACSILRLDRRVPPRDVQNMIHVRIEQKTTWGEALPSVSGTHNVTTGVHLQ